jgi:hypothetical protein
MSKTLKAMLFPFLHMFSVEGGDGGPVVEPQATEENVATAPDTTAAQESENKPEEAKTFTQDEVDSIVQKRIAKLERKMERERIAQQTREQIAQEQAQKPAEAPNKPKESDFETYGDYLEALTEYKAREILRNERAEAEAERSRKAQQSEAERYQARQQELMERGSEKFDDFEEAIEADRNTYSRAAFLAMLESDMGAELFYYLATNPDEGKRIANLPAYAQAKEIGKLEDKLQAKPQKQISKAPEPIKPVGSGKASSDTDLSDDLPIDEWMKRRNKQVRG